MDSANPIEILMVEDNPGDVRLTMEVLKESNVASRLHVVRDGAEAIRYLRQEGRYRERILPDLILLDWDLPRMSGNEVLAEIKDDPHLRRIPVVVLTSSEAEEDMLMAYDHHANCFISKPLNLDQFIHVMNVLQQFWFTIVKLPGRL